MSHEVKVKLMDGGKMPEYKTKGAVCADCYARGEHIVPAGERILVPLGFAVELPHCYEMVVRPRSGFSAKGVDVAVGTVDEDYRGEVSACVINTLSESVLIKNGDRICQIAVREVPEISFTAVSELSATERGGNGFGSTGVK